MRTISLLSAKGSPGVTTTVVGLAMAWADAVPDRTALAVDADPIGGDTAAGILLGGMPPGAGMLALATARGLPATEAVDAASVHLRPDAAARLVPGVPDAARAAALPLAWDRVVEAGMDPAGERTDVLVDAGRWDPSRSPGPWLTSADVAVLVVRPTLPAVAAANRLATAWTAPDAATAGVRLLVLVVESPSPYRAGEVAAAVGLAPIGVIAHQPDHARVHSEGSAPGRGFRRSAYVRALHHVARDLAVHLDGAGARRTPRPEVAR